MLWQDGRRILGELAGKDPKAAGKLIGKWLGEMGDAGADGPPDQCIALRQMLLEVERMRPVGDALAPIIERVEVYKAKRAGTVRKGGVTAPAASKMPKSAAGMRAALRQSQKGI